MGRLDGEIAVITDAASGIGRAAVRFGSRAKAPRGRVAPQVRIITGDEPGELQLCVWRTSTITRETRP